MAKWTEVSKRISSTCLKCNNEQMNNFEWFSEQQYKHLCYECTCVCNMINVDFQLSIKYRFSIKLYLLYFIISTKLMVLGTTADFRWHLDFSIMFV